MDWDNVQTVHLDFLKELGNIGAGNAINSLAQMVSGKIGMEVPKSSIVKIKELFSMVGNEEELVCCVAFVISGDAPCNMFFILKHQSALHLVDRLMSSIPGVGQGLDDLGQSILNEVGNILAGAFTNAITYMTGLKMRLSVPAFANDMLGAVISAALLEQGYFAEEVLVIETRFYDQDIILDGFLFLLPLGNSLEIIFKSVGIE